MAKQLLLKERYLVIKELESGGFGHTYLAEDTHLPSRRRCVVKHLHYKSDNARTNALIRERFEREAAILEQISETVDQIPKLYAYFAEANELFIIEEYIEGETLKDQWEKQSRFSEEEVISLVLDLLKILEQLHKYRVIHRDIKPSNIMIRKRDGKPVLIDFGLVKENAQTIVDQKGLPVTQMQFGTPGFAPPEQWLQKPVFASDLYSLGVTAICLLADKPPSELHNQANGELDWRDQTPQVGPELAKVLDKATKANFSERYLSVKEMREALTAAVAARKKREEKEKREKRQKVEEKEKTIFVGWIDEARDGSEALFRFVASLTAVIVPFLVAYLPVLLFLWFLRKEYVASVALVSAVSMVVSLGLYFMLYVWEESRGALP